MSGPCLSPGVADHPLRPATRLSLGEPLPHQQADRPRAHPRAPFQASAIPPCGERPQFGINPPFGGLSRTRGQVAHVLRTRSPLSTSPKTRFSFDLHVLTMPPAFTLSQDQTLQKKSRPVTMNRHANLRTGVLYSLRDLIKTATSYKLN